MDKWTVLGAVFASYKFAKNMERDSTMAKALGIEPTALSNYKNGARKLPDRAIAQLADGLGAPVEEVLACANLAWSGTTNEEKEFWYGRLKNEQLRRTARVIMDAKPPSKGKNVTVQLA